MDKIIARFNTILALLPLLSTFVKNAEDVFAGQPGAGAAKLELVRAFLEAAHAEGSDLLVKFEEVWPFFQAAIAALVNAANSLGLFKKVSVAAQA